MAPAKTHNTCSQKKVLLVCMKLCSMIHELQTKTGWLTRGKIASVHFIWGQSLLTLVSWYLGVRWNGQTWKHRWRVRQQKCEDWCEKQRQVYNKNANLCGMLPNVVTWSGNKSITSICVWAKAHGEQLQAHNILHKWEGSCRLAVLFSD